MKLNVPAPSPRVLGGILARVLGGSLGRGGWETDGVVRLNVPAPSPGVLGVV